MVASSARGQLNEIMNFSLCPFAPERMVCFVPRSFARGHGSRFFLGSALEDAGVGKTTRY